MAKLEPQSIVNFIVRTVIVIIIILVMMLAFFSFRVDLRDDGMKRFLVELADSLTSSELTDHKSVFNPQKLTAAEKKDPSRNVELHSVNCDYGYAIDVESTIGPTECSTGSECRNFCKTACGLDDSTLDMATLGTLNGNCGCNIEIIGNNFCQCKKTPDDDWQDSYHWSYGYVPSRQGLIAGPSAEFPAGLSLGGQVVPAKLRLTAYDSFLTRISCAAKKAYELKEKYSFSFAAEKVVQNSVFKRKGDDYVCMYIFDEVDYCRYFPGVPFLEFQVTKPIYAEGATITAYPLNTAFATCEYIKSDRSVIADKDDDVFNVLFCMEGRR